jgi:hypothetical protein
MEGNTNIYFHRSGQHDIGTITNSYVPKDMRKRSFVMRIATPHMHKAIILDCVPNNRKRAIKLEFPILSIETKHTSIGNSLRYSLWEPCYAIKYNSFNRNTYCKQQWRNISLTFNFFPLALNGSKALRWTEGHFMGIVVSSGSRSSASPAGACWVWISKGFLERVHTRCALEQIVRRCCVRLILFSWEIVRFWLEGISNEQVRVGMTFQADVMRFKFV